jgi:hypothetical protein
MDLLTITFFLDLGIQVILASVALYLYRQVLPEYRPMILFVIVLLLISISLSFFDTEGRFSQIAYSTHYLLEGLFVCWLGVKMKSFKRSYELPAAVIIIIGAWVVERFITGQMDGSLSWSRVVTSAVIAFVGIRILTETLVNTPDELLDSAVFLFSVSLVFYYAIGAVMELYALTVSDPTQVFMRIWYYTGIAVSMITHLIYLKAILCVPKKLGYYLR